MGWLELELVYAGRTIDQVLMTCNSGTLTLVNIILIVVDGDAGP